MKMLMRALNTSAAILTVMLVTYLPAQAQRQINNRFASVNGVRLHYLFAGKGEPVLLLHGYAQNSQM